MSLVRSVSFEKNNLFPRIAPTMKRSHSVATIVSKYEQHGLLLNNNHHHNNKKRGVIMNHHHHNNTRQQSVVLPIKRNQKCSFDYCETEDLESDFTTRRTIENSCVHTSKKARRSSSRVQFDLSKTTFHSLCRPLCGRVSTKLYLEIHRDRRLIFPSSTAHAGVTAGGCGSVLSAEDYTNDSTIFGDVDTAAAIIVRLNAEKQKKQEEEDEEEEIKHVQQTKESMWYSQTELSEIRADAVLLSRRANIDHDLDIIYGSCSSQTAALDESRDLSHHLCSSISTTTTTTTTAPNPDSLSLISDDSLSSLSEQSSHRQSTSTSSRTSLFSQQFTNQRGLERWSSRRHFQMRQFHLLVSHTQVFLEQSRQLLMKSKDKSSGLNDIATIYQHSTKRACQLARILGHIDYEISLLQN